MRVAYLYLALALAPLFTIGSVVMAQSVSESQRAEAYAEAKTLIKEMDISFYQGADSGVVLLKRADFLADKYGFIDIKGFVLNVSGAYEYSKGNYKKAEEFYFSSLDLVSGTGFYNVISDTYLFLGRLKLKQAEFTAAKKYFDESYHFAQLSMDILTQSYIYANYVEYFTANSELDSAILYLNKNHQLILKLKDTNLLISSYFQSVKYNLVKGQSKIASDSLAVAERLIDSVKNPVFYGIWLTHKGMIAEAEGDFKNAVAYYQKSLESGREIGSVKNVSEILILLGETHNKMAIYDQAMLYFVEASSIAEKTGNVADQAMILADIGMVLKNQRTDVNEAKSYLWRSLQLNKNIEYPRAAYRANNSLGLVYITAKQYDSALFYITKAFEISEKMKDPDSKASSLHNLGLLYDYKKEYNKALTYYERSLNIEKARNNLMGISISFNSIGDILGKMGRSSEAIYYLKSAENLALENDYWDELEENYKFQSEYYERVEDYKNALIYFKKNKDINNQLFQEDRERLLNEVKAQYDLGRKEKEIELLNQSNILKEQELQLRESVIHNQKLLVWSAIIVMILAIVAAFIGIRYFKLKTLANEELMRLNKSILEKQEVLKNQANELLLANESINKLNETLEDSVRLRTLQLKKAIDELDTFFYRSSHDFRRPITTLLGLANLISTMSPQQEVHELTDKIKETVHNLDKMIRKIQSFSNLDLELDQSEKVPVVETINAVLQNFEEEIHTKNAVVKLNSKVDLEWVGNKLFLEVLMENLLENCLAFGNKDLIIDIEVVKKEDGIQIRIEDNGQGIEEKYQSKVFDMFFRASEASKGNGLGLYLVKKFIDRMQGTIEIKSEVNMGTSVVIYLPESVHVQPSVSIFV